LQRVQGIDKSMLWTFFVRKINKYKMYIIYIFNEVLQKFYKIKNN